jgi:hypothetical protein
MRVKSEYRVAYERDANSGWWVATVPELPGCLTQGRTIEQTRKRIREAIAVGRLPARRCQISTSESRQNALAAIATFEAIARVGDRLHDVLARR